MKSFVLQQLARLIIPAALLFALALLLKGHDDPGGGFVAGLSLAVVGILGFATYGAARCREVLPVDPARLAIAGGLVMLLSAAAPMILGDAFLAHQKARLAVGPFELKLLSALVFEIGVVMIVGGGLCAAALSLWETPSSQGEEE